MSPRTPAWICPAYPAPASPLPAWVPNAKELLVKAYVDGPVDGPGPSLSKPSSEFIPMRRAHCYPCRALSSCQKICRQHGPLCKFNPKCGAKSSRKCHVITTLLACWLTGFSQNLLVSQQYFFSHNKPVLAGFISLEINQ